MFEDAKLILQVAEHYFDMLYTANPALAETLFLPEAHVQSLDGGRVVSIDLEGFKQRMAERPVPRDRNELRDGEVLHLDFAGPACAHVKLRSTMLDRLFIDYLTLLKVDGRWRILAKAFHVEPTPQTTARPDSVRGV